MEIDEQYVLKAFSKCFACIEQLEKKIDSLAKNEVGINGGKFTHICPLPSTLK